MTTIYKDNTNPLTIGETKRLIIGAMPTELAASIFASFNEQGDLEVASLTVGEPRDTCIQAHFIDVDFPALCQQQGITPRHKYRPVFMDYSGAAEQDAYYTITHDEFVKLAKLFGATVEIGTAPAQSPAMPAPVVNASDAKPWLVVDPRDPAPAQHWYTPARYFARQLVVADSTLLTKRLVLADKVANSLAGAGIYKRGGNKAKHAADTVLKAFANVTLG